MILPDQTQFTYKDCVVAGDECWLITPQNMGVDWTDDNARFRSCIIRKFDNKVISQSLKKFKNFHETPTFQPWDYSWPVDAYHKKDGSTIILSAHKGYVVVRTRGTCDVGSQETGPEVYDLIGRYPQIISFVMNGKYSVIFEHTTPNRIIVLREDVEPTLTLLAIINNEDAKMMLQSEVDEYGKLWNIARPKKYHYNSIPECIADVEAWVGSEGVVLYSPDGNTLKKIKACDYLRLHRLFSGITNINHVIEVFLKSPRSRHWEDFFDYIEKTIGYEIAFRCMDHIQQVCVIYSKMLGRIDELFKHLKGIWGLPTQKEKAMAIIALKLPAWEQAFCFEYLKANGDGEILDKLLLKAFDYYLENNL